MNEDQPISDHRRRKLAHLLNPSKATERLFVFAIMLILVLGLLATPASAAIAGTTTGDTLNLVTKTLTENDITVDKHLTVTDASRRSSAVSLSVSANTSTEAAATVVTVTATADSAVSGDQTVDLAVTGTNITASDYTLSGTTITIPGGTTSGTVTFTIVNDNVFEGDETATLTISNPSSGVTINTSTANIVITDNDEATIAWTSTAFTVAEDAGNAPLSVTLTAPAGGLEIPINFGIQPSDGNAIAGDDYTSGDVNGTFATNAVTGDVVSLNVPIIDDEVFESIHSFEVYFSSVVQSNVNMDTDNSVNVNITDDDTVTLTLDSATHSVAENVAGGEQNITVTISGIPSGNIDPSLSVTAALNTVDATAAAPGDYTALTDEAVSFAATASNGDTKDFAVTIQDDTVFEGDENFTVELTSTLQGVTIGAPGQSTITIQENELPPDTEVTLVSGVLTITDINGGNSNDALTISHTGSDYTIADAGALLLTTAIAGASGDGTSTLTIPDTGVTGIKFDTLAGNDSITVTSIQTSLTGEFTIEAGDGTDTATINTPAINAASITLNDSVTLSQSITLTADEIDFGGGASSVSGAVDLTLAPATASATIGIGGGTGTLDISDTDIAALSDGFTSLTIGDATNGTGAVDVDSSTFSDPVTIAGDSIDVDQLDAGTNAVNLTARTGHISTEDGISANTDVTGSTATLNGNIAPGASSGQLVIDGDVTFTNGKTFNVELNGTTAGTDYDQLKVTGANRTVTLDNATLSISISGYTPASGDELVIIDNVDPGSSIASTFNGLAEGDEVTIGGNKSIITYQGGTDNNDVVLQFLSEIDVLGNGQSITNNDNTPSTTDGTDFGNAVMLSDTISHTFTISNIGGVNLMLSGSPKVSLSTAGIFTVTNDPTSPVVNGTPTTFVVEFAPNATGVHTTTVSIANDDTNENPYTFNLQGTGVSIEMDVLGNSTSIANGDITPSTTDNTDFGNAVVLSDTVSHTFTISNSGTSNLVLSGSPIVSLSNSGIFTVTTQPTSPVTSGSTSDFIIEFGPSAMGVHTATVTIANDDSDENPYTFVIQGRGDDNDGVNNSIEDMVPGLNGSSTGDGNGDGILDSLQENVASLQGSTNDYVTFATDSGKRLANVIPEPEPTAPPTQVEFPYGHFSFDVMGLSVGEAFTVTLVLHGNQSAPTTFWKYGPTSDNNSDHWYDFTYDGTTGAIVSGNTITLHFKDGERGDSDLTANGQIRDPGAPAINPMANPPVNQAPQLNQPIPDITVIEGAANQSINLLNYFSDPDGDSLFFTIVGNSNREVAPNLLIGQRLSDLLSIQFGVPGQTEITIRAEEEIGHKTYEDTFIVTVLEEGQTVLSMSKNVSDRMVNVGQQITYTIALTNSGSSMATNALISDALPTGLTFVPGSISATGITTGTLGSTPPTLASGVTLLPNQMLEISFAATVDANVLANQTITNTAQVTSTEVSMPVQASNLITIMAPTLAISDVIVAENDGNAIFPVTLSNASAVLVTVNYSTVAGSATAADYTPISGTLTIATGATSGSITVPITNDDLQEEQETFTIQLTSPSHATIADGEAVGTINDDDMTATNVALVGISTESSHNMQYVSLLLTLLTVSGLLLIWRRRSF